MEIMLPNFKLLQINVLADFPVTQEEATGFPVKQEQPLQLE